MNNKEHIFVEKLDGVRKLIEQKKPGAEIARFVGVKYETLKTYFKKYGINYSGNPNRTGFVHEEARIPLSKILNNEITYSNSSLRKRLIECGLKDNKCECCGITEWNGKDIKFELHHIDGNHYNNNLDNLQILCPNCHSQTFNFRKSKSFIFKKQYSNNHNYVDVLEKENKSHKLKYTNNFILKCHKKKVKKYCSFCGKELTDKTQNKYCSQECSHKATTKRPTVSELIEKINEFNNNKSAIGRFYGVSDAAVRKWIKFYNIK